MPNTVPVSFSSSGSRSGSTKKDAQSPADLMIDRPQNTEQSDLEDNHVEGGDAGTKGTGSAG